MVRTQHGMTQITPQDLMETHPFNSNFIPTIVLLLNPCVHLFVSQVFFSVFSFMQYCPSGKGRVFLIKGAQEQLSYHLEPMLHQVKKKSVFSHHYVKTTRQGRLEIPTFVNFLSKTCMVLDTSQF